MDNQLEAIFARLRDTTDFTETDFSDVNATSSDGDNALHFIVRWGDFAAAKSLIDAGIDINKAGDLGYTPLHVACMQGNAEMVKLLIDKGADMFALSEGYPPGSEGTGFDPWLKRSGVFISRKTAYRLIKEYAEEWDLVRPEPRSSGRAKKDATKPEPALLPGKQASGDGEQSTGIPEEESTSIPEIEDDADFISLPTSLADMEELFFSFIEIQGKEVVKAWWPHFAAKVEETLASDKAPQNQSEAA